MFRLKIYRLLAELPTIEAYDGDQYMPTDCGYLVMPCSVGDDNDIYDKVVDGDQTMIISKFAEIRGKRCESEKSNCSNIH